MGAISESGAFQAASIRRGRERRNPRLFHRSLQCSARELNPVRQIPPGLWPPGMPYAHPGNQNPHKRSLQNGTQIRSQNHPPGILNRARRRRGIGAQRVPRRNPGFPPDPAAARHHPQPLARGSDLSGSEPPDRRTGERPGRPDDRGRDDIANGQRSAAIERLGIPEYNWWNEALHGVARAGLATVFPQVIGLAATWNTGPDPPHGRRRSPTKARAKHHEAVRNGERDLYTGLTFFCPNINIFRDPRWGRGQETYGEDPYLTARLAVNFIQGMQGDDPHYLKTVATAKHFAVHSGPEKKRHAFNAVVSQRDLRMTYLPAFEACVAEGKVGSIMGAYNRVNGEACCASPPCCRRSCARNGGSTATSSPTAARSTTSYCNHAPGQIRGRKPPRWPSRAAATWNAAAPTASPAITGTSNRRSSRTC